MEYILYEILKRLDKILAGQKKIADLLVRENKHMSAQMDALITEVQNTVGVEESVLVLIDSLVTKLQSALDQLATSGADLTQLQTLATDLATEREKLAAKVATNPGGSGTSTTPSGTARTPTGVQSTRFTR
jgi:hypothetical protein